MALLGKNSITRLVALLAVVGLPGQPSMGGSPVRSVEIQGVLLDCWQGEVIRIGNVSVYVYAENEQKPIWRLIEQLRDMPPEEFVLSEGISDNFREYLRLYSELEQMVEKAHPVTVHTRTNKEGEFAFRKLRNNRRYLVLAINLQLHAGTTYYKFLFTEKLKPGKHQVKLWMIPESECLASKPSP